MKKAAGSDDEGGGDDPASDPDDEEDDDEPEDEEEDEEKPKRKPAAKAAAAKGGASKPTPKTGAAAGPEKAKKVSDKEAPKVILEYMRAQNRPFNAIMLQQNLHGAISLAQAKKLLPQLASENKLTELINGKQSIYWINQDGLEVVDAAELREFDEKLKAMKGERWFFFFFFAP